jgi:hypothetical protein
LVLSRSDDGLGGGTEHRVPLARVPIGEPRFLWVRDGGVMAESRARVDPAGSVETVPYRAFVFVVGEPSAGFDGRNDWAVILKEILDLLLEELW